MGLTYIQPSSGLPPLGNWGLVPVHCGVLRRPAMLGWRTPKKLGWAEKSHWAALVSRDIQTIYGKNGWGLGQNLNEEHSFGVILSEKGAGLKHFIPYSPKHFHEHFHEHFIILSNTSCKQMTKVHLVKAMVFPVVMYKCESWTVKKAEHRRIDAFELWCWRRLLRASWTAKRSNQSILKEINLKYLFEGLMLKL